jgi:PIN domain nuclease of toxin-antitoxin system
MKLLLDTHALVWHFLDSPRLPESMKLMIDDPSIEAFVSAASAWEIATKVRIGRFAEAEELAANLPRYIREYRFAPLPITIEHGHRAALSSRRSQGSL